MPRFLPSSDCCGTRPRKAPARASLVGRPALVARLMRERHVPRFIIAPPGFGKTAVALEYAETVFGYESVFWVDAKSPCFLRDLDKGIVASSLLDVGHENPLVVIEDVPALDEPRADQLSQDLDTLLDAGAEVLLTCTPACDAFERHHDRILLSAPDLLLSDAELDEFRTPQERDRLPAACVPASGRVPSLAWREPGDEATVARVLAQAARDDVPLDAASCLFAVLCLVNGDISQIIDISGCSGEDLSFIAEHYPYAGINMREGTFHALECPLEGIAEAFAARLVTFDARRREGAGSLGIALANVLLEQGSCRRACEVVSSLCPKKCQAKWLACSSQALFEAGCLEPASSLFASLGHAALRREPALALPEALRLLFLDDREGAYDLACLASASKCSPPWQRAMASLVLAGSAPGSAADPALETVLRDAEAWASETAGTEASDAAGESRAFARRGLETEPMRAKAPVLAAGEARELAELAAGGSQDPFGQLTRLKHLAQGPSPEPLLVTLASGVLAAPSSGLDVKGASPAERAARAEVLAAVSGVLSKRWHPFSLQNAQARPSKTALVDTLALEGFRHAREQWGFDAEPWERAALERARPWEESLMAQRAAWEGRRHRIAPGPDKALSSTTSGHVRSTVYPAGTVEKLRVRLFGGLEAYIGARRINPEGFNRRNVRILLALLVLNHGREFSRDYLVRQLWPQSSERCGRRNFYNVWSLLKQALSVTPDSCPYLIRQQLGVRLDSLLLESDVMEMDALCQKLLFEPPEYSGWPDIYRRVTTAFAEDLLPSERTSPVINLWRDEYRNKLVDALTSAATRLLEGGNGVDALWFAQAAHQRDALREDVCCALMRCQAAAGQRTAAIETYHECRRRLADELGIDPSLATMRLYSSIIESEELVAAF